MSFTGEINQKLAGNFSHRSIVFNKLKLLSLTPSQAIVTDANKNLTSLAYTNLNNSSTLVQRDASGNFSAGTITATITGHSSLDLLASNNLSDLTSVSTARSNLGLVIGTNVEAWSATLDAVAAGTYTGSTSITTLGTISTGTWAGTVIGVTHGGTGLTSTTVNQILYSSATNTIGGITVVNSAALLTNGSGVPGWVAYTGSGAPVLATSPTLVTPLLGTPTSGVLTNCTGLPLTTGITGILPVANGGSGTATPALVQGTNISITGSWPNQTINVVNNPTFTGLVTIQTTSNISIPLVVGNNNISATSSQLQFQAAGSAMMTVGYDAVNGMQIFNPATGNVWLYNNKVDKKVLTFNNTLDDGSGATIFAGLVTASSGIKCSSTLDMNSQTADNTLLLFNGGASFNNYGIGIATGQIVYSCASGASIGHAFYAGGSSSTRLFKIAPSGAVNTKNNTLDNGTTGAASFAGPVTLPGNATSALQAVPLQQLTNNGPSVNITQHTYAGGF